MKVKLLSCVQLFVTPRTVATRLLGPWDFPGNSTRVGCHFLLQILGPAVPNMGVRKVKHGNQCVPSLNVESSSPETVAHGF